MTREDAIKIVYYGIHPEEAGKLYSYEKYSNTRLYVDMLEKLGMLKLDEPEIALCKEDADWNWWLLQSDEFKASTIRYLRKFIERR